VVERRQENRTSLQAFSASQIFESSLGKNKSPGQNTGLKKRTEEEWITLRTKDPSSTLKEFHEQTLLIASSVDPRESQAMLLPLMYPE
jgi:hypothetical protein